MAGGAYALAASGVSNGVIYGCYGKKHGTLRVVSAGKKCHKSERSIRWNAQGRTGAQGAPGSPGAQGPPGPEDITAIPLIDVPNGGSGTIVDLSGVGKLAVTGCAAGNTEFKYTNESDVTQNYVLTSGYTMHFNTDGSGDSGALTAGSSFDNGDNDGNGDLIRLVVSNGTGVVDFTLAETSSLSECRYWGEVYSG